MGYKNDETGEEDNIGQGYRTQHNQNTRQHKLMADNNWGRGINPLLLAAYHNVYYC
jgi:hypothetical protein